jgi:hypothetical protein
VVGMIQIVTYVLAVYLVMKGIEILQIGLAPTRENRDAVIAIGVLALVVCIVATFAFD